MTSKCKQGAALEDLLSEVMCISRMYIANPYTYQVTEAARQLQDWNIDET